MNTTTTPTNAKHSPSPWRIDGETIRADNGWEVCNPYDTDAPTGLIECGANAALIASAPDLLSALKSAVSYLEANRPKGNIREIFHQLNEYENGVLKPARAAIAQAEGGAQ